MTWTLILVGLIGLIYPVCILLTYQNISNKIKKHYRYRLIDYKLTLISFWSLTILVLTNHFLLNPPDFNLYPAFSILNVILIIMVLIFSLLQYKSATISPDNYNAVKKKLKDVYYYLPKTRSELNWFIILSISAGICEEILFRLFLFEFLRENVNIAAAFMLSNLIFALTHIGSGKNNLVSSFILGTLFSAIYYFTRNIWIAMLLHSVIDINAGIMGYKINQHDKKQ